MDSVKSPIRTPCWVRDRVVRVEEELVVECNREPDSRAAERREQSAASDGSEV